MSLYTRSAGHYPAVKRPTIRKKNFACNEISSETSVWPSCDFSNLHRTIFQITISCGRMGKCTEVKFISGLYSVQFRVEKEALVRSPNGCEFRTKTTTPNRHRLAGALTKTEKRPSQNHDGFKRKKAIRNGGEETRKGRRRNTKSLQMFWSSDALKLSRK